MHELLFSQYQDHVLAGWLGKSIGGTVGACVENQKTFHNFNEDTIWPAKIVPNDDLDLQILWLEAMQEYGIDIGSETLAKAWQERCWYNFCEYGVFLHNIQRGIYPPLSGKWNNDFFGESEGCVIRSEIWGFISPGNSELAAELARRDAQIDHYGLSIEIEAFWAACMSEALIGGDLERQLQAGISVVSRESQAVYAVEYVKWICSQTKEHKKAWRLLVREFGDRDASKAITNHAIVLLALMLGGGDFKKTVLLAVNSGWDTDCTAATAGAILAAWKGTAGLPKDWVSKIGIRVLCGIKVKHQNALFTELAEQTCRLGVEYAALRNKNVSFLQAAPSQIRSFNKPVIDLSVEYPSGPVLKRDLITPINLQIMSDSAAEQAASVSLSSDDRL
ncbi:MAG TPA: ADP-ribosylglycohydrolase family protein, partial [Methylococcales bacterium]